ncbi:sensor histidine kinase [Flavobacterium sp.]|uniref:sensor histidine kinase n=1 Tax=Flavobacterium sp. TaxID=239 RepID=UPI0037511F55
MEFKKINTGKLLTKNRWIWHFVFWLLYATSRLVMYYYTVVYYERIFLEFMLIMEVSFIGLVYFTISFYKKMNEKKKIEIYFIVGLIVWTLYLYFRIIFQKYYLESIPNIKNTDWFHIFIDSITAHLLTFFIITALKYLKDNFIFQYTQNELRQHQLRFELENLKAQISPHFLFNTMNNFYGLAVSNSKKLPDLMIKLSDLLRYSLYQTNQEKVALFSEISYLKNYIELEKIRLEDNLIVQMDSDFDEDKNYQIAPLLLMVFVENAFKHSRNSTNEPIKIFIHFSISIDKILNFKVVNNYDAKATSNNILEKGIGLENVKKRLEVLYPNGNHFLEIKKDHSQFICLLTLNLN